MGDGTKIEMDRGDLERGDGMFARLAGLHQLLCDEAGGNAAAAPSELGRADAGEQGRAGGQARSDLKAMAGPALRGSARA